MSAIDGEIIARKSDCFITGDKQTPLRIIVHSTGCNNPYLKRYVQPNDGIIGDNPNHNSWNERGQDVCAHFAIGKDKNGNVKTYQTLPVNIRAWGVYQGVNGSWNDNSIQFEILEDNLNDKSYCKKCYDKAVELCTYLCKQYNIPKTQIFSHKECGEMGYGSKHIDPMNWWAKHGYTMNGFRKAVAEKINGKPVLDATGYKKGDDTIGSLCLKKLLLTAKVLGLHDKGFYDNGGIGGGTINAINAMLKKWGFKENGIAGKNFIIRLCKDINSKLKSKGVIK